jgi:hypothetical protein
MNSRQTSSPSYWLGVASAMHVARGVAGGFAQLCHGKAAPLQKMKRGDWLIYYSPTHRLGDKEPLRAFTAIGQVSDEEVYSLNMDDGFISFRRSIQFETSRVVPLSLLSSRLHLTDSPHWGMKIRKGHRALDEHDFQLISSALLGSR